MNIKLVEETLSLINCRSSFLYHLFYNYLSESPKMVVLLSNQSGEYKLRKTINYLFLIISNFRNAWLCRTLAIQMIEEKDIILSFILEHELAISESLCKTLKFFLQTRWTPEVKQAWLDIYNATLDLVQQEEERYQHSLKNFSSQNSCVEKLRVKAIAKKALREGCAESLIIYKLLEDDYFQKIAQKLGQAITLKIISNLVKNARSSESNVLKINHY